MILPRPLRACALLLITALASWTTPAFADLVLSKVILDVPADAPPRDDIELFNGGDERLYVVAEPARIHDPGMTSEQRQESGDPSVTGLLVSPQKLILEPGERKLVRVASVLPRDNEERVYRVAIKPVAGDITANTSALKVFVGYDVLVIMRPQLATGTLEARRDGDRLTVHNASNSNIELAQGRQCDASGNACQTLPAKRVYAGADWSVSLPYATPVEYDMMQGAKTTKVRW